MDTWKIRTLFDAVQLTHTLYEKMAGIFFYSLENENNIAENL